MPKPDGRRRFPLRTIKILIGLLILYAVFSKLTLRDHVELLADPAGGAEIVVGTLRPGDAAFWLVSAGGEEAGPFLLDRDEPVLDMQGEGGDRRYRLTLRGRAPLEGVRVDRRGHVVVELPDGGGERRVPFAGVALRDGGRDGEWIEQVPAIREGLATIFGRISAGSYLLAMGCVLAMYLFGIRRWQRLLAAQQLSVSFFEATRLTFIGFFFNNVVPGMTGGDVVKALLIARAHPGKGPDAVSTVIVDRALGLLVLAALAAIVLLFSFDTYRVVAIWVLGFLFLAAALILLFLSRRVRRFLRFDALLGRLPGSGMLKRLDRAFLQYRRRPGILLEACLLSAGAHVTSVLSVYFMGMDLGVNASGGLKTPELLTYMATVPIVMIVSSIPLLPGGWGLGEVAFGFFFRTVGIQNLSLSVGLSVLHRFSLLLFSLAGGIFLLLRPEARAPMTPEEAEAALEAAPRPGKEKQP